MRSAYRIPNAARGEYASEYRLLCAWAALSHADDKAEVMRDCGLTRAGSPPNVMDSIYVMGERKAEDVTGYPEPPPMPPDAEVLAVTPFMDSLRPLVPAAHAALVARHLRLVHGDRHRFRSESWLAQALYCTKRAAAHARLALDCDTGYAALRRWRENLNPRLANAG